MSNPNNSPFDVTEEGLRHALWAKINSTSTVHYAKLPHGAPAWLITGFEQARAVLTDARFVKLGPSSGAFARKLPENVALGIHSHLLYMNPPDHGRLRKLVASAFTRRRVEDMEPFIRELTGGLLEELSNEVDCREIDLVARFAYPLPMRVIGALLGIPQSQENNFRKWTAPLMSPELVGYEAYAESANSLLKMLRDLITDKRSSPSDDLLSALIHARDGADRLSENELTSMVYLLVLAGHETTVNLITNAVFAILTHHGQMAALAQAPETIDKVIEEALRYDGSTQTTMPLKTITDVVVDGVTIPAGSLVFVSLLAANRDPRHFTEPSTFDPAREDHGHLAFGHGIHYCLGAPLARLEARVAVSELVNRFPKIRLTHAQNSLTRTPSVTMNALDSLPVTLF